MIFISVEFGQVFYRIPLPFLEWSDKTRYGITPRDIAQFKRYLKDECRIRKGKPLSPATINRALTALTSFYRWFQQAGYISLSETLPTATVKFEKLGDPLPRHLNPNQIEAIRHTYASELVELDIDNLLARSLTGHKSEKVFERYVNGKSLAAAEDAFFRAIGEAK